MEIKPYLVEFEHKQMTCVVRYLCDEHFKGVVRLQKELEVKFITEIHGDIYDKKCHLCKRKQ